MKFRFIRRASFLLVVLTGAFAAAYAQQAVPIQAPFVRGEELVYQAEFNRSLLRGINGGELRFTAKPASNGVGGNGGNGKSSLLLVGDASAKGFLLRLFGSQFHLHVESVLNAESLAVLSTKKVEEQKKRTRVSDAIFDHTSRKVTWTERNQGQTEPPDVTTVDFTEPVQDVLTVIYYVRTQRLEPGQTFEVPLTDVSRVYRCSVNVIERKKIKTIFGQVNAVRVEPAIFGDNRVVRSRGTLSIWFTDDARRIPVKAQIKVPLGTFDITLKRATYPDASRVG